MGFLVKKITGNGSVQTVIENSNLFDAVVNSLVAYNSTNDVLTFDVRIGTDIIFKESVNGKSTFRIPDKINLGANSTLSIYTPVGLDVTVSYLQQGVDDLQVLNASQKAIELVQSSSNNHGEWSTLTGSFPKGEAVNHNDIVWLSNDVIDDITASEPVHDNTDWTAVSLGLTADQLAESKQTINTTTTYVDSEVNTDNTDGNDEYKLYVKSGELVMERVS